MRERPLHASRRNNLAFFLIKRFAVAAAFAGPIMGRTGVSTDGAAFVHGNVHLVATLMRARSMIPASNIRPCELPIFVIVLVIV